MTQSKPPTGDNDEPSDQGRPHPQSKTIGAGAKPNDVGAALRNAFRATVEEDVPSEMMDLLRRLD